MFLYRPVKKVVKCTFSCIHTSYEVLPNINNTLTLLLMNWEEKDKQNEIISNRNWDVFLPIVCYLVIMISFVAAVLSVRGDVFQAGVWRA